jgi:hypothetical protein
MCEVFYVNTRATYTPFAMRLLFLLFKLNISNLLCIYLVTIVHGGRSRHKSQLFMVAGLDTSHISNFRCFNISYINST